MKLTGPDNQKVQGIGLALCPARSVCLGSAGACLLSQPFSQAARLLTMTPGASKFTSSWINTPMKSEYHFPNSLCQSGLSQDNRNYTRFFNQESLL